MKRSFIILGTILLFTTAVSAQSSQAKAPAPVTKEKNAAVKTDKAVTTTAPVKIEIPADEPISPYANQKSKAVTDVIVENEVVPATVEKPATPAKVATAGKPATKAKTAKTKN